MARTGGKLEKYNSSALQIGPLLRHIDIVENQIIFEPCVGTGIIPRTMKEFGFNNVRYITNDIDEKVKAMFHYDAAGIMLWNKMKGTPTIGRPHWVITNPPFNLAARILAFARQFAIVGVAFQLRLSWLEPAAVRAESCYKTPPTKTIVLPRYSFSGDGETDRVTTAWFVWLRNQKEPQMIISYPRPVLEEMYKTKSLKYVDYPFVEGELDLSIVTSTSV